MTVAVISCACSETEPVADPSSITVLVGNGDGTFQPGIDAPARYPRGLAQGDFNGDAQTDLVVANGDGAGVFLGNGDGTYGSISEIESSSSSLGSVSIAVADLDRDGSLDFAVATYGGTIQIFHGAGDGTFQLSGAYSVGATHSIAIGDFDSDGSPDLCVALWSSSMVSVLLNNGDGTFREPVAYVMADGPFSIAVGDFNADGHADLATANTPFNGASTISVLLGTGDGAFQAAHKFGIGGMFTLTLGDFDQDSKLDIAAGGNGSAVFLNDGVGGFRDGVSPYRGPRGAHAFAVADFNGDGRSDLAATHLNPIPGECRSCTLGILLGNGDGSFQPEVAYGAGAEPPVVITGDYNGDGTIDLAVANSAGNLVL